MTDNKLPYSDSVRVRYSDTDAQGHLYFANYMVFADEVTGHYMEELGYPMINPQLWPTLIFTVKCNCEYLQECGYGDVLRVSVGYTRLGRSSAQVAFEICNELSGTALAKGSFTQVFVDHASRKSCMIPQAVKQAILLRQPELL